MTERFMVDDCGTLIDMTNRDTYDYVSDVCELLNELHEENEQLKQENKELRQYLSWQEMELEEMEDIKR